MDHPHARISKHPRKSADENPEGIRRLTQINTDYSEEGKGRSPSPASEICEDPRKSADKNSEGIRRLTQINTDYSEEGKGGASPSVSGIYEDPQKSADTNPEGIRRLTQINTDYSEEGKESHLLLHRRSKNLQTKRQRVVTQDHPVTCHVCYNRLMTAYTEAERFNRITSDCRIWQSKATLYKCNKCHVIQPRVTRNYIKELSEIYSKYEVYHQGNGNEQPVFTNTGVLQARSQRLIDHISKTINIPQFGKILDIGCANGAFLKTFSTAYPEWHLYGSEFTDQHQEELLKINNFKNFFHPSIHEINEKFDFISLIHTLEHIVDPVIFLNKIKELLNINGFLFIQVPYFENNPFELFTVDHVSHFTPDSLELLLISCDFTILTKETNWVKKEISFICQKSNTRQKRKDVISIEPIKRIIWLSDLLQKVEYYRRTSNSFGLFGSSIAATWVAANLSKLPDFFIDEDPARQNRYHLGKKIISPLEIPRNSNVYIPLVPDISSNIVQRYINISSMLILSPNY